MVLTFQDIGNREQQQDAYHIDEKLGLFIVCDGVGGGVSGEIASRTVINSIVKYLSKIDIRPICTNCILDAIRYAQGELNEKSKSLNIESSMGTTLALLSYQDGNAITAHLGDSRIMLYKNKSAVDWSTKDHSLVQELFDAGVLKSEEEMADHPMKNRITNALHSGQNAEELSITTHDLRNIEKGDAFLLFTDGILEVFNPSEIVDCLKYNSPTQFISAIENYVRGQSKDNSTLILFTV